MSNADTGPSAKLAGGASDPRHMAGPAISCAGGRPERRTSRTASGATGDPNGQDDTGSSAAQSALSSPTFQVGAPAHDPLRQTQDLADHAVSAPASGGLFKRIRSRLWPAPETDTAPPQGADSVNGHASVSGALGLLNLRRMQVQDVAMPKVEIVAVPVDIQKEDLLQVFRESGLTRLPVYQGTLDNPLGMVHLKDFALNHGFDKGGGRFNLRKMLRPLLFAPPSMPIGVLLQKMQSQRVHLALVIDEYGGVDGLATIEDLIEQVIGEIEDEHDAEESQLWTMEKPGCYLVQARAPLEDFQHVIGVRLLDPEDEEEIDTLGGLVFMLIGRVPARGEVIPHPAGPEFEIVDADPRRIKRLRVRVPHTEAL